MSLVVSKRYKYIFFHLPKNAGVSVSRMLIDQEKMLQHSVDHGFVGTSSHSHELREDGRSRVFSLQ